MRNYNNEIIQINTFNEILEMRDTMQSPILMYTEENEDIVNHYLSELYDLCDVANIFLAV